MKRIFITGSSASGKSTLGEELKKRGMAVIDIDKVIGSCNWYKKGTKEVAEYYPGVGKEWLNTHEWICDFKQIEDRAETFKDHEKVYIVGITTNQYSFLHKFDQIFLLQIDKVNLLDRLKNRTTNYFGKDESEQEYLLKLVDDFEEKMIKLGAIPLDATQPIEELADIIISS